MQSTRLRHRSVASHFYKHQASSTSLTPTLHSARMFDLGRLRAEAQTAHGVTLDFFTPGCDFGPASPLPASRVGHVGNMRRWQATAVNLLKDRRDVILCAPTGAGKTTVFQAVARAAGPLTVTVVVAPHVAHAEHAAGISTAEDVDNELTVLWAAGRHLQALVAALDRVLDSGGLFRPVLLFTTPESLPRVTRSLAPRSERVAVAAIVLDEADAVLFGGSAAHRSTMGDAVAIMRRSCPEAPVLLAGKSLHQW